MEWLTNYHDPSDEAFAMAVVVTVGETQAQAVENVRRWLANKIIGEPWASEFYTVEQLKASHMVGVYRA